MKRYIKSATTKFADEDIRSQLEILRSTPRPNVLRQAFESAVNECRNTYDHRNIFARSIFVTILEAIVDNPNTPSDMLSEIQSYAPNFELLQYKIMIHPNATEEMRNTISESLGLHSGICLYIIGDLCDEDSYAIEDIVNSVCYEEGVAIQKFDIYRNTEELAEESFRQYPNGEGYRMDITFRDLLTDDSARTLIERITGGLQQQFDCIRLVGEIDVLAAHDIVHYYEI